MMNNGEIVKCHLMALFVAVMEVNYSAPVFTDNDDLNQMRGATGFVL